MKIYHLLGMITASLLLKACSVPGGSSEENEQIVAGKALYEQSCAACHGIDGEGQPNWRSPDANGVYSAPPHTNDGHTWHHSDTILLETIANGGVMPNSSEKEKNGSIRKIADHRWFSRAVADDRNGPCA